MSSDELSSDELSDHEVSSDEIVLAKSKRVWTFFFGSKTVTLMGFNLFLRSWFWVSLIKNKAKILNAFDCHLNVIDFKIKFPLLSITFFSKKLISIF